MPYVVLIIFLAIAFALQLLTGNIPISFLSFPLNLVLALIWAGSVYILWKNRRKSGFVGFMLSKAGTISSILLFLTFSLVIGLTGKRNLVNTWVFAAVLLYFQTVLLFVILRGCFQRFPDGKGKIRWRFLLNHAGLLLAVSSAFWGAPDSESMYVRAIKGIPAKEAVHADGTGTWLPYEIELKDFRMEEYDNGVPSMFEADIVADGQSVTLRVNEPYSVSLGSDIYLTGYDVASGADSSYCILQIVREPWKYAAVAGILMMLAGAMLLFINGPERRKTEDE